MIVNRISLACTLALSTVLIPSFASAYTDVDLAIQANRAVPFDEFFAKREQRFEMAKAIQIYWSDFDNRLPRLSPNELEWLQAEMSTNESARINRLTETREFHVWQLGNLADKCTSASGALVTAMTASDGSEMFYWSKVASCYHQSDGNIFRHLKGANLDNKGEIKDGHSLDHLILSKVLAVIIPSAMADAMGWTLNQD